MAAAIAAVAAALWYVFAGGEKPPAPSGGQERRVRVRDGKEERPSAGGHVGKTRGRRERPQDVRPKVKPDFSPDLVADAKLSAEFKRMLVDLQNALDLNDRKKVFALVHKLQLMDEWPDGIPKSVKLKALGALSWFGASGMAEAVGFLADSDASVREEALDTFQEQFEDSWDLGDYKLADTMKSVVKVVADADRLESYFDQFANMRDTVKADLALAIYKSGNETAVKVLEQNLSTIFDADGYEVTDRAGVEKFQQEAEQAYKDDPTRKQADDEMYGPVNWEW